MKKKQLPPIILFLFILLSACNSQGSSTGEAGPAFIPFTDETLGISLEYPQDWVTFDAFSGLTIATNQAIIEEETFTNLGEGAFVNIITGELAVFNFQINQEIQPDEALIALGIYKQLLEQAGQSFQVVEPPVALNVTEASSGSMTVLRSLEDGQQLHTVLAVILNEDYIALISAASLEFKAEEYRPTFDRIIQSVRVFPPNSVE